MDSNARVHGTRHELSSRWYQLFLDMGHCGKVKKRHNFWDAEGGLLYSETVEGLKIKGDGVSNCLRSYKRSVTGADLFIFQPKFRGEIAPPPLFVHRPCYPDFDLNGHCQVKMRPVFSHHLHISSLEHLKNINVAMHKIGKHAPKLNLELWLTPPRNKLLCQTFRVLG